MPKEVSFRSGKAVAASAVAFVALAAGYLLWSEKGSARDPNALVRDGEIGFVLTDFGYALGPDSEETDFCPDGMSLNLVEAFQMMPEGARRPGETDDGYGKRIEAGGQALAFAPDGRNYCVNPEIAPPDPYYRILQKTGLTVEGLNLDGKVSPKSDFVAPDGTPGVDNQLYRLVGCSKSFQSTGQSNSFGSTMATGEWGILIGLKDVDDLRNDDHVEVGLYANADPMQLSPTREPLAYASYALDQDPRFRATTTGRIKDGILTTDPVDVRFHSVVNSMHLERPLRDARLRATLSPDGTLSGIMAGFTPVEALYNYQFGYRDGKDGAGNLSPAPLRMGSANGAARVLGHTCPGVYQAMYKLADGHPDKATGRNTSISTQYYFKAANAFLLDVETGSANDDLVGAAPEYGTGS